MQACKHQSEYFNKSQKTESLKMYVLGPQCNEFCNKNVKDNTTVSIYLIIKKYKLNRKKLWALKYF